MNQNRCWPGVPNRYSTSEASMVIRPKSIATLVAVLAGTAAVSSTARLAAVITTSVVTGSISDTAPTRVVLPTPNPPAMTIFTAAGAGVAGVRVGDPTVDGPFTMAAGPGRQGCAGRREWPGSAPAPPC